MRVRLALTGSWSDGRAEVALGPTLALLDALAAERSVQGAAGRLGLSYRAVWGRIAALEAALGRAVAEKTKGHGTVLTPFGDGLREALGDSLGAFRGALATEERTLARRLGGLLGPACAPLRLAASHDPLLAELAAARPDLDLVTTGSLDALAQVGDGRAAAAGFHFGAHAAAPGSAFAAAFADPGLAVRPLFSREQGLMLAPGNPLGIAALADLPRARARLVQRQRGSGTRLWFERLWAEAGLDPGALASAGMEEFTHQAVAALIASGAADAGMGTRAVADRFGLAFLSLGTETYFLAVRREAEGAWSTELAEAARRAAAAAAAVGYAAPSSGHGPPPTAGARDSHPRADEG
ncbi:substrate-binding domain-containing protein [Methylobacterium sp.]|uniref:substrate-binding domain-containing protein n=1 Tax=Methylobacterium sp. TaxID=409 RepID=UPI0025848E3E|nr:substrate-binding domain-containing protein [Methylobacterium sp.]